MRCLACRKLLTSEVSKRYRLGPVCLARAVANGTLPMTALTEQRAEQKATKRPKRTKPEPVADIRTLDLFDHSRQMAIDALHKAAADCRSCGVMVTYQINNSTHGEYQ